MFRSAYLYLSLIGTIVLAPSGLWGQAADASNSGNEAEAEDADGAAETTGSQPTGILIIQIFDEETGDFLADATVIVENQDDSGADVLIEESNTRGQIRIPGVPVGRYRLTFSKSEYETATLSGQPVVSGEVAEVSFSMRPDTGDGGNIFSLPAFEFEVEELEERAISFEAIRRASDSAVDFLTAEDFARLGVSDIAGAIGKVPGISVVEGQFAVIRGLSDRYSSTSLNGIPVPSSDPIRQSIQLDLFPTSAIDSLVVEKTFLPDSPGNSSGGAISLTTKSFPDAFEFSAGASYKFNVNAKQNYLRETLSITRDLTARGFSERPALALGDPFPEAAVSVGRSSPPPEAISGKVSFGGNGEIFGRRLSIVGAATYSSTYETANGFQEDRFATPANSNNTSSISPGFLPEGFATQVGSPNSSQFVSGSLTPEGPTLFNGGDLIPFNGYNGTPLTDTTLPGSDFIFDLTNSTGEVLETGLAGFGLNLDEAGNHSMQFVLLGSRAATSSVQRRENGFLPEGSIFLGGGITVSSFVGNFTLSLNPTVPNFVEGLDTANTSTSDIDEFLETLFPNLRDDVVFAAEDFTSYQERRFNSFQLLGDHVFTNLDNLEVSWVAANTEVSSNARQTEFNYFENETTGEFFTLEDNGNDVQLGVPLLVTTRNILEEQDYVAADFTYPVDFGTILDGDFAIGFSFERSSRNILQSTLEFNDLPLGVAVAPSVTELAQEFVGVVSDNGFTPFSTAESERDVAAWYLSKELRIFPWLRIVGGARLEKIQIETEGNGVLESGLPVTTFLTNVIPQFGVTAGEILGIDPDDIPDPPPLLPGVPGAAVPGVITGDINEELILPALSVILTPTDNFTVRIGYSETAARPSFRELSPYVSRDLDSADSILGNPALELSDVVSRDVRFEYVFNNGDLVALSFFEKKVSEPIEQVRIQADGSDTILTFINNPNEADIRGFEIEARKNLGTLIEGLENFSIGGNFTFIDATVKSPDVFLDSFVSLTNSATFAGPDSVLGTADDLIVPFTSFGTGSAVLGVDGVSDVIPEERRLFDQPERIINLDLTYANPEVGLTATVVYSQVSDVLDAAGSGLATSGAVPDTFRGGFHTVDLVLTKTFESGLSLSFSVDNVTDSTRTLLYDSDVSGGRVRQEFRVGRTYSFGIDYSF